MVWFKFLSLFPGAAHSPEEERKGTELWILSISYYLPHRNFVNCVPLPCEQRAEVRAWRSLSS